MNNLEIIIICFSFFFGTILGSFVNVISLCLEKNRNFFKKKWSKCPKCKHRLGFLDLIPLFSFIFLGRRCRHCKAKISWRYFIVEICNGLVLAAIAFTVFDKFNNFDNYSFNLKDATYWLLLLITMELFVITFLYDLKKMYISDTVVVIGVIIAILLTVFYQTDESFASKLLWNYQNIGVESFNLSIFLAFSIGAILPVAIFGSVFYISKGKWIGGGDIKLMFWLGLLFGWPVAWVVIMMSFIIGSLFGILLVIKEGKTLKTKVPFGPFLVFSAFICMMWGDAIYNWYLELLGMNL